ncbi:hypothetical protein Pmani_029465 [Petrolisthes manimaculis]|uniref:Reverse transcriptase Ty1/copia-type domain-containing protein n=1 Tax=Petrolisthes manimaculis TaxID=1843537 RepID=A0AAE1P034_9EUCA|nr:hypothetical protein Pmani_029465 [Petrolisthes manimaculis]
MNGNGDGGERARVPAFGGDKNYDRWKQELKAWKFVTNIGKKKQAMAVALSFPEGSEVRSKIFEEVNIDELMNDDGMNVLLQHLDKWYQKDEMSAAYEAWTRFDTFTKVNEDAMEKYILEFVKRNAVLEKYKVSIPKCILAFKLLDNAGLDIKDKQIVLTAVSFSEPEKMFDSMQQALKKFFGSQEVLSLGAGSGNGKSETPAVVVKTEPVFSTEEVNVVNRGRGRGGFRRSRGRGNIVNRTEKSVQQNSVDRYGNVRKCYVCGSEFHLSPVCPKNTNVYVNSADEEGKKEIETYAVVESPGTMSVLMTETICYAILDTACSSTVCGVDWLRAYIQTLSEDEKSGIQEESSEATFRFGDGNMYKSTKKVKLPVNIIGNRAYVIANVVDCSIPLLFSKKSMKKAKMKLDLENDIAVIHGKKVKLRCTSSGHYCLLLRDEQEVWKKTEEIMLTLGSDEKEKKKKIEKLHQQFGHPTCRRLIQLLKDGGIDDEMCFVHAEEVSNSCDICVKYKKTPSKPIEIPYSFDRDTKDGRNSLLDTLRHQTKEGKTEKKEIEAVINPVENPVESYDKEEEYHSIVEDTHEDSVRVKSIPKIGQKVKFLSKESDEWQTVTMHSRAGKSTGKYSNWRNVKYEDGSLSAFDWNRDVEKWIPILEENGVQEPSEIVMACENMENQKLDKAKQEEIKSWKNFGVYEEVTNMGQNALSVRWVVTEKENMDGKKKIKARLVARGFEDKEEVQSDSPTVSKEMLRSFVAILASKKWGVNSIDIKAAFLQSERFERDVYLIPPTEADCDSNVLWKLQKCVYGLNDAARKWYLTVKTFMLKMGCTQVKTDPAAFYWYDDGELCGMFLMHVDDFLWGGTKRFENVVIAKIRSQFQVKEQNKDIFKYIGLSIVQNDKGVTIHQNEYCKLLEAVNMDLVVLGAL